MKCLEHCEVVEGRANLHPRQCEHRTAPIGQHVRTIGAGHETTVLRAHDEERVGIAVSDLATRVVDEPLGDGEQQPCTGRHQRGG